MPRIINFTMEVTDEEYANFLTRFATRSTTDAAAAAPAPAAAVDDGDTGPVNTAAPSVDSAGVPWLEAVHASTKSQVADGTWRGKKGVTPEQRAAAEAPYKNAAPAAAAPMPTFTPPVPVAAAPVAPAMPLGLPGMPPIAPAVVDVPVSMEDVIAAYQGLAQQGKISPEQTTAVYAAAGVTDVNELMNNETLRRAVVAELKKYA